MTGPYLAARLRLDWRVRPVQVITASLATAAGARHDRPGDSASPVSYFTPTDRSCADGRIPPLTSADYLSQYRL